MAGMFLPASLIGSLAALTCLFRGFRLRPSKADLCVIALLVASAFGVYFGSSTGTSSASAFTSMLTLWVPGYLVGRIVCERAGISFVKTAVSVAFGIVGLLAIVEKLLGWHMFVVQAGMNSLAEIWAPVQSRGGEDRSEWAFGHSIALGGSLALSIPFLLASALKTKTKLVLLALILGGVATTYSRGAMLAAGLTLVLSLLTARNLRSSHRVLLLAATIGFGVATSINFAAVSDDAGTEVSNSSDYRISLFTRLLPTLEPIGRANSYVSGVNQGQYGNYTSIDNAFMAQGLGFGWIAMLIAAVPFIGMGVRYVYRRATFAEIAMLGQLPVITTVALITQYQVMVWMVAGLSAALASSSLAQGHDASLRTDEGKHITGQQRSDSPR
ncbi:hypothetical protein [Pseudarthrobacter enclensis]|uniref:hypothetical protein n=1 Tax=Pseudarthrobacter enclensis TaxID=993070 RepID=UPI003EE12327